MHRQDHCIIPYKSICRSSGCGEMYLTMKDKFFIPNLMHYLRSFIKGCHICQLSRSDKPPTRQLQPRIYLNYRPLSKLSMDLKVMPRSQKGHKFILCIIDEMTNYLITAPIHHSRSEEVGEALIEHIISKFCAPNCIIMDQDSAFMSTLMNYLFRKLNIKIMTVAPVQPPIFTGRTWYQVTIKNLNKTFVRTRTDVA